MKFHLENAAGRNLFTGYGAGYVAVNRTRYETALVVTADRVLTEWPPRWEDLGAAHFEFLLGLQPEIVLLGTGRTQKFAHPALSRCLHEARVGLEFMDTPAACRTYNILAAEGRNVVAALWV